MLCFSNQEPPKSMSRVQGKREGGGEGTGTGCVVEVRDYMDRDYGGAIWRSGKGKEARRGEEPQK